MNLKKTLIAVACVAVVTSAGWWTWQTQFNQPKFNVALHTGLGQIMAEQTLRAINRTGLVVVVTLAPGAFPELGVQLKEFKRLIAAHRGVSLKEYELDTDERPKFHFGAGLSTRRYVRIVNKNLQAAAIVSFVGAPDLKEQDLAELKASPKFIAECRTTDRLKRLFVQKALQTALVGRYEYPTPIKGTPKTPHEWVVQRFQIVTPENAASLPSDGGE